MGPGTMEFFFSPTDLDYRQASTYLSFGTLPLWNPNRLCHPSRHDRVFGAGQIKKATLADQS